MKIRVKLPGKSKTVELKPNSTILDLFNELGECSESYVVKRNSEVAIEIEKLKSGDEVELIRVVSGG
ncbi:MAG: MoaD/ThiS family protein [archaeon]